MALTMSHPDPNKNNPATTVKSESPILKAKATPKAVVMPSPPQRPRAAPASKSAVPAQAAPGPLEKAIAARAQSGAHPQATSASQGPPSSSAEPAASMVPAAAAAALSAALYSPPSPPSTAALVKSAAAASSRPKDTSSSSKIRYKKRTKKYNNFNIFFMLERQLLLQSRGGGINAIETPVDVSDSPMTKYKPLNLPPLCRRYEHLPLTTNWFLELLASQNKKRPHRKSHGLIPFKELAQTVAKNYREIDDETQSFVNEVAERLGWHCEEIELAEEREAVKREEEESRLAQSVHIGQQHQQLHASQFSIGTGNLRDVMGASLYAGKKRKDAPVIYSGSNVGPGGQKKGLSQDEAATVQQLMGMKSNSPSSAAQAQGHNVPSYPPPGPRDLAHFASQHFPPSSGHNAMSAHHPSTGLHAQPPPMSDIESERLQVELARAMNARLESERRIHLLRDQMTAHRARQTHHGPGPHHPNPSPYGGWGSQGGGPRGPPMRSLSPGYQQYLAMLANRDAALPQRPNSNPIPLETGPQSQVGYSSPSEKRKLHAAMASLSPNASMEEVEKTLLKEALLRGLLPADASDGAPSSAPARSSNPRDHVAYLEAMERAKGAGALPMGTNSSRTMAEAPLKKRARHSHEPQVEYEALARRSEYHKVDGRASGEPHSATAPSGGEVASSVGRARSGSDIGYYRDLYSKMVANKSSSQPPSAGAPNPDVLATLARDHPSLAQELAGHRDRIAIDARDRANAAREAALRDLTARDAASRDMALFDGILGRGGGSSAEQRALLDSLAARGPPPPASGHGTSSSRYPPSSYPPSNHGQSSYSMLLSQLAGERQGGHHGRTPPPPLSTYSQGPMPSSLARAEAAAFLSQARGSSASPRNSSLLEMVHAASRKSQFGLSYNDMMNVWKEKNRERANNNGEGGSPVADEGVGERGVKKEGETGN